MTDWFHDVPRRRPAEPPAGSDGRPPLPDPRCRGADAAPEGPLPAFWSPQPVLGYRFWHITQGAVRGVVRVWPRPFLDAQCPRGEGVPHVDCRCGIYARREPSSLWLPSLACCLPSGGIVYGLVALSGRVIEHERGYRAAHARAVALVVRYRGCITAFADEEMIDGLFRRPERVMQDAVERGWPVESDPWPHGNRLSPRPPHWGIGFLQDEAERIRRQWT